MDAAFCPECGFVKLVAEDGCCDECGGTATGEAVGSLVEFVAAAKALSRDVLDYCEGARPTDRPTAAMCRALDVFCRALARLEGK